MENIKIFVAKEFSDAPGARDITDGENSGEAFYTSLLRDRFAEAIAGKTKLYIDFDGTWGYASSFISGAFGRLADQYGKNTCIQTLEIKSEDDPILPEKIRIEFEKSENDA